MSGAVSVRLARAEDYEDMCALLDAADELHRGVAPWLFRTPESVPRTPEYFADFLRAETCAAFVADAARVVGVALVLVRSTPPLPVFQPCSYAVLDALAVHGDFRRHGVGTRIVDAAVQWTRSRGARWLELGVYELNRRAIDFYDALGFEIVSRKMRMPL